MDIQQAYDSKFKRAHLPESRLQILISALQLDQQTAQQVIEHEQELRDKSVYVTGLSENDVLGGLIYIIAARNGDTIPLSVIAKEAETEKKHVAQARRYLTKEYGLSHEPVMPADLINRMADRLDIDTESTDRAYRMAEDVGNRPLLISGRSPSGLAATCIYMATPPIITQRLIGRSIEITKQTISKNEDLLTDRLDNIDQYIPDGGYRDE